MIETLPTGSPKIVGFKLTGKLHHEDYKSFVPTVERSWLPRGRSGSSSSWRIFTEKTCTPFGMTSSSA